MPRNKYEMRYNTPRGGVSRLCYCKNTYTKDCNCDKYPHWEQGIGRITPLPAPIPFGGTAVFDRGNWVLTWYIPEGSYSADLNYILQIALNGDWDGFPVVEVNGSATESGDQSALSYVSNSDIGNEQWRVRFELNGVFSDWVEFGGWT